MKSERLEGPDILILLIYNWAFGVTRVWMRENHYLSFATSACFSSYVPFNIVWPEQEKKERTQVGY
jgi:hypothetical protein